MKTVEEIKAKIHEFESFCVENSIPFALIVSDEQSDFGCSSSYLGSNQLSDDERLENFIALTEGFKDFVKQTTHGQIKAVFLKK